MKKILLLLFFLCSCYMQKGIDVNEPPAFVIDANGENVTLTWKIPGDRDIAGIVVYWGEITHWRSIPPDNLSIVNSLNHEVDVGYSDHITFKMSKDRFYGFALKAYNKRREFGRVSKIKYWPYKPGNIEVKAFWSDPWHGYLHKTGDDITLSWDMPAPEEGVVRWETAANYINDGAHIQTIQFGSTTVNSHKVSRPSGYVGLFEFFVRACDAANNCSTWASSDDLINAVVTIEGVDMPGNWIVYWLISAPVWE